MAFPLSSGMASAHSFLTIHSSQSNRHPSKDRVGLAVRLVNENCIKGELDNLKKRCDRVTLLCGDRDKVTRFKAFESRPTQEFGEKEMREWQLSIQKENEFYFKSSKIKQYIQ